MPDPALVQPTLSLPSIPRFGIGVSRAHRCPRGSIRWSVQDGPDLWRSIDTDRANPYRSDSPDRPLGAHTGRSEVFAMNPAMRQSYGRTRRRRSHHALKATSQTTCPLSGMPKEHHRACAESGYVRPGLRITVPKLGIGVQKN